MVVRRVGREKKEGKGISGIDVLGRGGREGTRNCV